MNRPLLRKSDARAECGNTDRGIAIVLGITPQAVSLWGRYLPELQARRLLELRPALQAKVSYAKRPAARKRAH